MSHFTVIVFGENVDDQLAPYNEDITYLPEEYKRFNDYTDELLSAWESGTEDRVVIDGEPYHKWNQRFAVRDSIQQWKTSYVYPEENLQTIPIKELYSSFEEFAATRYPSETIDGETRYGYWSNPEAKWDWYQVGGRWSGYFKMKPITELPTGLGSPGVFGNEPQPGTADVIYKRDVDVDGMRDDAEKEAAERWDLFTATVNGRKWRTWKQVVSRYNLDKDGAIDKARAKYHSQEVIRDLSEAGFYNPEDFQMSREKYIERARHHALAPFAYVIYGEWHGRGEMGWWGFSTNDDERHIRDWAKEFNEFFDSLPDDMIITLVDCHI